MKKPRTIDFWNIFMKKMGTFDKKGGKQEHTCTKNQEQMKKKQKQEHIKSKIGNI